MKLILSKNQWQFIGMKTGWLKLKIKANSQKRNNVKISKLIWNYIGFKTGWLKEKYPYVYQSTMNVFAVNTTNITDEQIRDAIYKSIPTGRAINFNLISADNYILNQDAVKNVLTESFTNLINRDEAKDFKDLIARYIANNKTMNVGAYVSQEQNEYMLTPTFNYDALTHFKIPFTRYIEDKGTRIRERESANQPTLNAIPQMQNQHPKVQEDIIHILQEMMAIANAAGILSARGKVIIESVGNRTTNWDTGYNFKISGDESDYLRNILGIFTQISNENFANTKSKKHYHLTKREEVSKLMGNLGLGAEFDNAVAKIKNIEADFDLKTKVEELGMLKESLQNPETAKSLKGLESIKAREKEYQENLKILKQQSQEIIIDLSALQDKVFNHIYNALIQQHQFKIEQEHIDKKEIKHAMATAFTYGSPITEAEIDNLVDIAI